MALYKSAATATATTTIIIFIIIIIIISDGMQAVKLCCNKILHFFELGNISS